MRCIRHYPETFLPQERAMGDVSRAELQEPGERFRIEVDDVRVAETVNKMLATLDPLEDLPLIDCALPCFAFD
jgi:hypothetical protein